MTDRKAFLSDVASIIDRFTFHVSQREDIDPEIVKHLKAAQAAAEKDAKRRPRAASRPSS
jgi:hypothetical protein